MIRAFVALFGLMAGTLLLPAQAGTSLSGFIGPETPYALGNPVPENCLYYNNLRDFTPTETCVVSPNEEAVRRIWITVNDRAIDGLTFLTNGVVLGDLVAVYGRPDDLTVYARGFSACWSARARVYGLKSAFLTMRSEVIYVSLGPEVC